MNLWEYDKGLHTLNLKINPFYEIDLDGCNSSAEVLDWIAQIANKNWATSEIIGDLVFMFNKHLSLQENICGWGKDHFFNADEWLEKQCNSRI